MDKTHPLKSGTKVRRSLPGQYEEVGVVVHSWYNEELQAWDYYVAFFGDKYPVGKPDKIPYVLCYLEGSVEPLES